MKQLEDDITALMGRVEMKEAAATIREFWERTVGWFRQEPGEAHVVQKPASQKQEKK